MKKIAFLSCGRSDLSIYIPLINALKERNFILTIIAFGSHTSKDYGKSLEEIESLKLDNIIVIDQLNKGFTEIDITSSMSQTILEFGKIWESNDFHAVIALGDRFEMFAAVASGIPFNINFIHMHGGEKTLGAIDDVFRHSITHMSKLHLTSSKHHSLRVRQLIGKEYSQYIHNVGSMALHNLKEIKIMNKKNFLESIKAPFQPYILITIHPETVNIKANKRLISASLEILDKFNLNKIFTLPNNDTQANIIRESILAKKNKKGYFIYESLGVEGYYNAIHHCEVMFGNSSSGIIESMYFKKNVVNIGQRQLGRETNKNIFHSAIDENEIFQALESALKSKKPSGDDIFFVQNAPQKTSQIIENYLDQLKA